MFFWVKVEQKHVDIFVFYMLGRDIGLEIY